MAIEEGVEDNIKIYKCEKCGFVKFSPMLRCPSCGAIHKGAVKIEPKNK